MGRVSDIELQANADRFYSHSRVTFRARLVALRWDATDLIVIMVVKEPIGNKTVI